MINPNILLKPVITEKATAAEKEGKYLFFVHPRATKVDIKQTFKKLYGVAAAKVNVIRTAGKTKIGKNRMPVTKKPEYKKVIITAKAKKNIDIFKPKAK